MTTIAGVSSSSSSELIQMLQELALKRTEGTESSTSTQSSQSGKSSKAEFESAFEDALISAGLDSSQLDAALADIQTTTEEALSSADESTDPREAVSTAVDAMLQEKYGVDTDALKSQMQSQMGSMPPQGPPPGGQGGGPGDLDSKLTDALTAAGVDSSDLEEVKSAIQSAIAEAEEDSDGTGNPDGIKETVHGVLDQYGVDTAAFDAEMESGQTEAQGTSEVDLSSLESQTGSLLDYLTSTEGTSTSSQLLAGLYQILDEEA